MPGGRPWKWLTRRTLGSRLVAGVVALLAVACAAVGVTTYVAVRDSVSGELDAQLQAATTLWSSCLNQLGGTMTCSGLTEGTFGAIIYNGGLTYQGILGEASTLSPSDTATLLRLSPGPPPQNPGPDPVFPRRLSSLGGEYLLTAVNDGNGFVLITGLPMATTNATLQYVKVAELVVFAAVLLLAGVLGTGWVRLTLRPLRRVTATATAVADLPLESGEVELPDGVPDADPHTEVGQVGAAFNRMLGHVQVALTRREASEGRLRRFAADASHELRTPLTAIRGYTELALRHPGASPEPVMHALDRVEAEAARMSVLVDDLLLLARLDAGRPLASEAVDLSRLTIDATADARVARPGHRWLLDLPDKPVIVRGDTDRLHQVLTNLLSNAGRHTPEGSTVSVRLHRKRTPEHNGHAPGGRRADTAEVVHGEPPPFPRVELTVTDDGPGITRQLLPELFERFTRGDSARAHAGEGASAGLGLAIVDAVVAAHHGAVRVASGPGMTRFSVELPLAGPD